MKRWILVLLTLAAVQFIFAQRIVNVPADVENALFDTINADSTGRANALPTQTIYVLARGGIYPLVSTIRNTDYFLYIKAADGEGPKPYIYPSANAEGGYSARNFEFYGDAKIENVIIDQARPTGGYNNRAINLYTNVSVTFKGCEVTHDRGGAFVTQGDSSSLYLEDCVVGNIGYNKGTGGNGRLIDVRNPNFTDTLSVVNCTIYYLSDRVVRNIAPHIKYVKFDHCTFFDNINVAGFFMVGKTHVLTITNNILRNPIAWGTRLREQHQMEQTEPLAERYQMWVMLIDTIFADTKLNISNNNIYWQQEIKDIWAKYDSVETVGLITPTLKNALGADSANVSFEEDLTFTALPTDSNEVPLNFIAFVDSSLKYWHVANTILPENWYWKFVSDGGVDLSYGTSAVSYTAGIDNYPLGDLNWYPDLKTRWLNGEVVNVRALKTPTTFSLKQNYPNPFNPVTNITYTLKKNEKVTLSVYNTMGQRVCMLVNKAQLAGEHTIAWDGLNNAGQAVTSGVYYYKLEAGHETQTQKMILMK